MDFTVIGTLHSYVQQKNFKFAANYKKKTGQTVVSSSGNLQLDLRAANNRSLVDKMLQAQQSNKDEYSKQRVSSIKRKLLSGKKISNEELGYLKKNDPDLYKKAKKAEEAREDLKAALRKAKTKQEARQAVTQALIKASAEATAEIKAANAGGGISGIGGNGNSVGSSAGYESGQEIGGPNAEAIFGNVNGSSNEPSMIRLNEQINNLNTSSEAQVDPNIAAAQEGALLKDINNEVSVAREVGTEAAKAESINSAESINNKPENSIAANPNDSTNNEQNDVVGGIIEKFIMVVRAIEDEWATFSNSDEFKDLAEDMFEEAENKTNGKSKYKNHALVKKTDPRVMGIISTYRNSMMYSTFK